MEKEDIVKFVGKRIFLKLKSGNQYKSYGVLKLENLSNEILTFPDKYGSLVSIDISEISFITESRDFEARNGNTKTVKKRGI